LHKREIQKLQAQVDQKGLTLIPLSLYFKNGKAKVELALARRKNLVDKRRQLAKREADREAERAMARRTKQGSTD
jgi:SsrA-binding protein